MNREPTMLPPSFMPFARVAVAEQARNSEVASKLQRTTLQIQLALTADQPRVAV